MKRIAKRRTCTLLLLLLALMLMSTAPAASAQQLQLAEAFPDLRRFRAPVDLQAPGDGTDRLFAVEQAGRIRVFENRADVGAAPVFLDIRGRVASGGERGLLGLAFHPDYAENGFFYVNYTTDQGGPLRTVIARFEVSEDDPDAADPASEVILLEVNQPYRNHNAGQIQFGPDGLLYVALGDGGSGGDPQGNGQDRSTLLGSMLRLDTGDGGLASDCGGASAPYTIPTDNPFVSDDDACGEIWAYGFRNPFRFSFGPEGFLFAGDVGQNRREEIDIVEAGQNYGWNVVEGTRCYPDGGDCDTTGLTPPIIDYRHNDAGGESVTGGYVYTGTDGACSPLDGRYVYADFVSGNLWSLAYDEDGGLVDNRLEIQNAEESFSTFGRDAAGNLFVADYGGGRFYRFDCSQLPVELLGFSVTLDGADALLAWETASETNNAGFAVEQRAPGAAAFAEVAFVEGAGTTAEAQRYTHRIENLAPGTHAFRLRQTDRDGAFAYSQTVEAAVALAEARLSPVAPNPLGSGAARFTLAVQREAPVTVAVYDLLGRRVALLHEGPLAAGAAHPFRFETKGLPSGLYFVRAEGERFSEVRAVTVVR